jgi:hypothetical protein
MIKVKVLQSEYNVSPNVLKNIGFPLKGKLKKDQNSLLCEWAQDPPLCIAVPIRI